MALTMRATGLGHGVYKVDVDYSVFSGEWLKARPPENSGSTSSLDAAKPSSRATGFASLAGVVREDWMAFHPAPGCHAITGKVSDVVVP
jgi:hypothetical protein